MTDLLAPAAGVVFRGPLAMFRRLPPAWPDSLTRLQQLMQSDARPDKIDLGVGTYRDARGDIPILDVVKRAERHLLETQRSKGYLGPLGDRVFAQRLCEVMFPQLDAAGRGRLSLTQAPGGTGALRLALEIVAQAQPDARVWIATPSWPVHGPLVAACGLQLRTYAHLDAAGEINEDALASALEGAQPGDVFLLHGCCHNPTGVDLGSGHWRMVAREAQAKGLLPLIDLAYPGLGDGVEADVRGARLVLDSCENGLVALSCSKSFGLYRDRTGLLIARTSTAATAALVEGVASAKARTLWSNPPDHGAAVVRTILASSSLVLRWRSELDQMRERVQILRAQYAALDLRRLDLSGLRSQRGMFALLPLRPDEVDYLREAHGVYMDSSGRINVAGLNAANGAAFTTALQDVDARVPPQGA